MKKMRVNDEKKSAGIMFWYQHFFNLYEDLKISVIERNLVTYVRSS